MNRPFLWLIAILLSLTNVYADTCIPPNPSGTYQLVFADEFDGDSLDRNKWNTEFLWGPGVVINNEEQYYVSDNQFGYNPFKVDDGVLTIQATKRLFDRSKLYLTSAIYSSSSAELLWRIPSDAVLYKIYRDGVLRGTATGGSYLETDLEEGFDYAFEVVALNANSQIVVTAQLTINTANRPKPTPPHPGALTLNLDKKIYSRSTAELLWQPPNRAGRFDIYRNGRLYRTLPGGGYSSLYEPGLTKGKLYSYRVVAFDRCGEFIIEEEIAFDTAEGATPVLPPSTRVKLADAVYSDHAAELFWDPVAGATSFNVYRDDEFITSTHGRSFFINDLVPGIDNRFTVVAKDQFGNKLDSESRTLNTADNSYASNRQPFLSGIITSYSAFRFLYGKVEVRARMPAGNGMWSAFWLLNAYYQQDQPDDPEIDIIEAIGDKTNVAHHAYHYRTDPDGDGIYNDYNSTEFTSEISDFSNTFHTFGVEWSEGLLLYFVDGLETHRISGAQVSSEQMYLLANLAIGGVFPGPPDETTPFPAKYELDYIRVWQLQ